jgi:hypothetical protein
MAGRKAFAGTPMPRELHVDQLLTNVSVGYSNLDFIADQIFPIVPVNNQSGLVPKFDQSAWFRDEAQVRSLGTRSVGGGWGVSQSNYFAIRYSYRGEIYDEVRDNADSVWDLEVNTTNFVTQKLMMRREVAFATDFFKTGVWANDDAAGTDFTAWDDYGFGTPFVNLTNYQDEIETRIAREGDVMVMGKAVWNKLRWHPDLVDTIKFTERGIPTLDLLQAATGFRKILIGRSLVTTDPEGTAEASVTYSRIWGKNVLILNVPDNPSLLTPAAGYTFTWARVPNSLNYIVRYRDDERETDIIEGNTYFDQVALTPRAGVFLSNVVS